MNPRHWKAGPAKNWLPATSASNDTMCENLFDGVSQPINDCVQCGIRFEGTGDFCSDGCVREYETDLIDERWDD